MSNLYIWGGDLVAKLGDYDDGTLVKILNSSEYKKGAVVKVPWGDKLIPQPHRSKRAMQTTSTKDYKFPNYNACPTCQTPNFMQGIECPGCGFKEWLQIQEMSIGILKKDDAEKAGFEAIDMRFEDYPEGDTVVAMNPVSGKPLTEKDLKAMLISEKPFYARMPNSNTYLFFNGTNWGMRVGEPVKTKAIVLPNFWFNYAAIYSGNNLIKPPQRAREFDVV